MSELENQTKCVLEPLVLGNESLLSPSDQLLIATWAVKTAMIFEFVNAGRLRVFTPDSRRFLMENHRPPLDARVRLAAMHPSPLVLEMRRWNASKPHEDNLLAVSAGLRIGCVALNVLYAEGASREIPGFEVLERRTDRYIPLFPPSVRDAPFPTLALLAGDDDFDTFVREPFVDMNQDDRLAVVRAEQDVRGAINEAAARFGRSGAAEGAIH